MDKDAFTSMLPAVPISDPLLPVEINHGDSIALTDATGTEIAYVPGDNLAIAAQRAALIATSVNLCAGLPLEGMLSGRFAIVDVNPDDPRHNPFPPRAVFLNAVIMLLVTEDGLATAPQVPRRPGDTDETHAQRIADRVLLLQNRKARLLSQLAGFVNLHDLESIPTQARVSSVPDPVGHFRDSRDLAPGILRAALDVGAPYQVECTPRIEEGHHASL